ncbi:MAG: SusD/RagB family nutrient-binding outer membrane lipoprotein [Bacteroidota bacterium]
MKKIITIVLFGFIIILSSCKDEIDELFLNPDGATDTKIEYLFADAMKQRGAFLRMGYNPQGYYLILQGIAPWIQLAGNEANDSKMMDVIANMSSNSWNQYYKNFLSKVVEMEILYEALPDEEKGDYDVYMNMIKVVRAVATSKMTDLYGDIPYSEAGQARRVGGSIYPKYDSQQSIYTSILADLKETSAFFSSFSPNESLPHSKLSTQDLLNGGDASKWLRLSNSLRLRFAMRILDADPSLATTTVNEVANADLVTTNALNIYELAKDPDGLNHRGGDGRLFGRAFNDRESRTWAPELMVNMMNEANDPRRLYCFNQTTAGEYKGTPSSPDEIALVQNDFNTDNYSYINTDLILDNLYLPGIVFTSSEVHFLLAEAAMKGIISDDPKMHYDTALEQSVEFYHDLISFNTEASYDAPLSTDIDNLVNASTFTYDGTMEQLATQKWIHLGINQPNEAYATWRRHDLPVLQDNISEGSPLVIPVKITIPSTEKNLNEENYNAVKADDTPDTKVWWDIN